MLEQLRENIASWISPKSSQTNLIVKESTVSTTVASAVAGSNAPSRGTKELIAAYKNTPWLRAVAHRIASSISATPWILYYNKNGTQPSGKTKKLQRARNFQARQTIRKSLGTDTQEIYQHPFLDLIEYGNPFLDGQSCIQMMQTYLDLKGESFNLLMKNPMGMPVAYWPIPPNWVVDIPQEGKNYFKIIIRGTQKIIQNDEMLWIKDPDPSNPYGRGTGVAESLADELDTDEYAAQFLKSFFYNSAMPAAIVSIPNADPAQIERVSQVWNNQHRGSNKGHRTKFVNYDATVSTFGSAFNDLSVVELRRYERDLIHQVFGMPPEILGIIQNSNRATIQAADSMYAQWVLTPRLERIRTAFQNKIAPMFDSRLIVDYESPIPEDKDFRLKVMQAHSHAFERAEIRELAGLDSHGESDEVYLMPLNLIEVPVENSGEGTDQSTVISEPPPEPLALNNDEVEEPIEEVEGEKKKSIAKAPAGITIDEVDAIVRASNLQAHSILHPGEDRFVVQLEKLWTAEVFGWGEAEIVALGAKTGQPMMSFNLLNPNVKEHVMDFKTARVKGLIDVTTQNELRAVLGQGVAEGLGSEAIAKSVREVFSEAGTVRSRMIARTEVVRSSNFGTWEAQRQSGVVQFRRWVTAIDGREREAHEELNGQEANMDQPFEWGGFLAWYPGDFGEASLDINCRCTTVAVIPSIEELEDRFGPVESGTKPTTTKMSRAEFEELQERLLRIERTRRAWEAKTEKIFKARFRAQSKQVMAALREAARD